MGRFLKERIGVRVGSLGSLFRRFRRILPFPVFTKPHRPQDPDGTDGDRHEFGHTIPKPRGPLTGVASTRVERQKQHAQTQSDRPQHDAHGGNDCSLRRHIPVFPNGTPPKQPDFRSD
jgi:hypothetical protein